MSLRIVPMSLREANAFVDAHHRHHGPAWGCKFTVGVADDEKICGVAIAGRPVTRHLDDGWTIEVTRCCTDGTRNACSMLYAACRRAAWALGYHRLITYTLATEEGASLRAAGWRCVAEVRGESWNRPSRPRVDTQPLQDKLRWEAPEAGP